MPIVIIAVGKRHESWVNDGIKRYETRLRRPWGVEWALVPHVGGAANHARQEESERIRGRIHPDDFVVLLDERGSMLDSKQLSEALRLPLERSRRVVLVIGGAYGVDEVLMARADLTWSLSSLVFPHQLVRLILVEQLYRAQEIASGRPYHHE